MGPEDAIWLVIWLQEAIIQWMMQSNVDNGELASFVDILYQLGKIGCKLTEKFQHISEDINGDYFKVGGTD